MNEKLFPNHKKEEIITSLSQKLFKTTIPIQNGTFTSQKPNVSVQKGPGHPRVPQYRMNVKDTNDDPSKKGTDQRPLKHAYAAKVEKYFYNLNSNAVDRSKSMAEPAAPKIDLDQNYPIEKQMQAADKGPATNRFSVKKAEKFFSNINKNARGGN